MTDLINVAKSPLDNFNTINLDAMILPDAVLHEGAPEVQARLAAARREILQLVAHGQIRFVVCGGRKFRLEPWEDKIA